MYCNLKPSAQWTSRKLCVFLKAPFILLAIIYCSNLVMLWIISYRKIENLNIVPPVKLRDNFYGLIVYLRVSRVLFLLMLVLSSELS